MHERALPRRPARRRRRAGGDAGLRPARARARHPGRRRASSPPPTRACGRRSPPPPRLAGGARYTYAVCRPPGHHAGPDFLGGYCYLNNAAAAVRTLRRGGASGRSASSTSTSTTRTGPRRWSSGWRRRRCTRCTPRRSPTSPPAPCCRRPPANGSSPSARRPTPDAYLAEVAASIDELAADAAALVVSLGYDTVAGDPHGCWDFEPQIFAEIGRLLAALGAAGLRDPGGRLLAAGAGRVQPRLRQRPARGGESA